MTNRFLTNHPEHHSIWAVREMADRAFSRAAGAPLISGNAVRLLKDAGANYPAWLSAIASAKHHIHLESYFIREDATGRQFADALIQKAQQGVQVRIIYDWLGGFGKTSQRFWNRLRMCDIEVRCYNPLRVDSPFGWFSRDHRKILTIDGQTGFISGLCIDQTWEGAPERNVEPWRDTGVEIRGPAVWDIEQAFAYVWAMTGKPIPEAITANTDKPPLPGSMNLRIVASMPATAGLFRLDQLVAAIARKRLWLTDAYYAGTTPYVQSLRAAAKDGVDVRLLVPGGTDIPALRPLSRAGYRSLLEAGVRIFEWNGSMLHAKTAVADGHWARVGSTNLNIASWFGNCEMDVVIEDDVFASQMEAMFLEDMKKATELVVDARHKIQSPGKIPRPLRPATKSGSVGRAAAGAVRIGKAVGSAFTYRQVLEPAEMRLMAGICVSFLAMAALVAAFPKALAFIIISVFLLVRYRAALQKLQTFSKKESKQKFPVFR
ncbi:MAG: phospholipase D-like domain-containing protein [Smithellaceae bacterium]